MKNTILSLVLPLLLAAAPAAADGARLLWTGVDGSAKIVGAGGAETAVAEYAASGKTVNAFRVSVSGGGETNRLVFVHEAASGATVVGDGAPEARSLDFAGGGAAWAPVDLAGFADRGLAATMELGWLDWAAFDAGYDENDPATWNVPFTPLASAETTLGDLLDAPHVSVQSDLNPPAFVPWTPVRFLAADLPAVRTTVIVVE